MPEQQLLTDVAINSMLVDPVDDMLDPKSIQKLLADIHDKTSTDLTDDELKTIIRELNSCIYFKTEYESDFVGPISYTDLFKSYTFSWSGNEPTSDTVRVVMERCFYRGVRLSSYDQLYQILEVYLGFIIDNKFIDEKERSFVQLMHRNDQDSSLNGETVYLQFARQGAPFPLDAKLNTRNDGQDADLSGTSDLLLDAANGIGEIANLL